MGLAYSAKPFTSILELKIHLLCVFSGKHKYSLSGYAVTDLTY